MGGLCVCDSVCVCVCVTVCVNESVQGGLTSAHMPASVLTCMLVFLSVCFSSVWTCWRVLSFFVWSVWVRAYIYPYVCVFLCVRMCVAEDQGQCQARCQTRVLLFRPRPDPCLLHRANEHKQKTEEKKRGEYMNVCVCVCVRVLAGGGGGRGKGGLIRKENGQRRVEDRRRERKRTTTWFHPLLSHSWQRHALVTDRQITLLWLIKPGYRWREGRREGGRGKERGRAKRKWGRKEGRETGRVKERRGEETRRGGGRDERSWECGGQEVRDGEEEGGREGWKCTQTEVYRDISHSVRRLLAEDDLLCPRTVCADETKLSKCDKSTFNRKRLKTRSRESAVRQFYNLPTWSKVSGQQHTAENKLVPTSSLVLKWYVQQSVMFGCPESRIEPCSVHTGFLYVHV